MTFWQFLNHWWNLPSLVMLGLVGAYFALQTVGLVEHAGEGEIEHELDADHEVDADHDHDQDHDVDEVGEASARAPFMVVWLTLFIFGGFSGLVLNRIAFNFFRGAYPGWLFPISLISSLAIGLVVSRASAKFVARFVDVGARGSTRRSELPGRPGIVVSPRVDAEHGEVSVRDESGNELIVHARVEGARALMQGESVALIEYDAERGLYLVSSIKEEAGADVSPSSSASSSSSSSVALTK